MKKERTYTKRALLVADKKTSLQLFLLKTEKIQQSLEYLFDHIYLCIKYTFLFLF